MKSDEPLTCVNYLIFYVPIYAGLFQGRFWMCLGPNLVGKLIATYRKKFQNEFVYISSFASFFFITRLIRRE